MAIALRSVGTSTSAALDTASIAPAVPATAVATDLSILSVIMKPFDTTITTPSGWTKVTERTNGTVAASGADLGSVKVAVYVQESATPGAIPNIAFTGADTAIAVIDTYSRGATEVWDFSTFCGGDDNSGVASFSITGDAGLNVATGDWVVATVGMGGDAGNPSTRAVGGMSGATITATARVNSGSTIGTDTRVIIADAQVTAGSSNAAPTYSHTMTTTFPTGSAVFLKLRVTVPAAAAPLPVLINRPAVVRGSYW